MGGHFLETKRFHAVKRHLQQNLWAENISRVDGRLVILRGKLHYYFPSLFVLRQEKLSLSSLISFLEIFQFEVNTFAFIKTQKCSHELIECSFDNLAENLSHEFRKQSEI